MEFKIRPYHNSDIVSLYRICLKTGDSGEDASNLYQDPDLLGHIYVGPYVHYEPDLCFIVAHSERPFGYILGTRDSKHFYEKCEQDWFPILRHQYKLPEKDDQSMQSKIIKRLHQSFAAEPDLKNYPAHLHIDILPEGQGHGLGRKLMDVFIRRLEELNVKGLHLGVGKKNQNAVKFYQHLGFFVFRELESALIMCKDI